MAQPLDDLRDVAASDSVDTFVLSYTSLLQVLHIPHPCCRGTCPTAGPSQALPSKMHACEHTALQMGTPELKIA